MKQYSTIHPLYMSFYSRPLYRHVGRNWKGISFLYLFLLLALCWIPITIKLHTNVSAFLIHEAPKVVSQVPVITISGGQVSIDEEMPYVIINPETDEPLIIIDTTGKYTSLETTPAWALLTKTSLILKKSETETRIFELSEIDSLIVDQDTVYGWIETIRKVAAIVLYPFALIGSFVYRILQVLLYAAIGLVIDKNAEIPLDYSSLVSLAIVANSPSILINTLYNYLDIAIPLWWLICFALSMGYLVFGIKACAGEKTSVAHS